jgi:hypothetical protein
VVEVKRWVCAGLAIYAAAVMGAVLWSSQPRKPFVYHYQWPVIWARPEQQIDIKLELLLD